MSEKTTLSTVIDTLNVKNDVKAFDADKELAPDDYVTTGTQLRLYSGSEVIHTVHIVVTGDVNCDGKISLVDFVMMKAYMLGELEFASYDAYSADINGDGKISLVDFIQFKAHMLGDYTIVGKEH